MGKVGSAQLHHGNAQGDIYYTYCIYVLYVFVNSTKLMDTDGRPGLGIMDLDETRAGTRPQWWLFSAVFCHPPSKVYTQWNDIEEVACKQLWQ